MKLNLKEALIRFNILQEGWMESLSNKYDEDILIFVGRMLQQAYPNKDVSNHPLAEWIAKEAKSLGEMPWKEPHKTRNEQSFQDVLNFIKEKDDAKDVVNRIKSMSAISALDYIKKEIENETKEEKELNGEEELREWLDKGLMKIIGRGPKGSFWVKPLKGEFFGVAQCKKLGTGSQSIGEFGIGCQRGEQGGFGAVGFGQYKGDTYSLLAKSKDGHYTTIISLGGNPDRGNFVYHALQFGNKTIGSEDWGDFKREDFMNAFVDFLSNNSYGKKIYKDETLNETQNEFGETISNSTSLPSQMVSLESDKKSLRKLAQTHPEFVKYYEKALKRLLGEEEYALLTIGARELYEKDPKRFMGSLPTYLKTEKEEALRILSEINFEEFIRNYGEDIVLKNIESIIDSMDYNKFQELIKPYINYDKFLEKTDKKNIKEIIRNFSEKAQNSKNTLPIINNMIESDKDFELIMKNFGDGNLEKGIMGFLASLATPRMSKHKNYVKKSKDEIVANVKELRRDENGNLLDSSNRIIMKGGIVYDEQGRPMDFGEDQVRKSDYIKSRVSYNDVEADVKEGQWILDYKSIRSLLKQNEDRIIRVLGANDAAKIKFLEYYLYNSSPQERMGELKKTKDDYIGFYNKMYDEGKSKIPGIMQLSKVLNQEKYRRVLPLDLDKDFNDLAKYAYVIPKEDYLDNIKYLNNFYSKNNKKSSSFDKVIDVSSAILFTMYISKFSIPEILENAQKRIDFLNEKGADAEILTHFLYNIVNIIPSSTVLKRFIEENLNTENSIGRKIREASVGYDARTGMRKPNQNVLKNLQSINTVINSIEDNYNPENGDENLQEQEIRKYIRNLFESNFKRG